MTDDNLRAALFMMGGASALAINDTFMKLLGAELPLFQLLLMRGVVVTALFGVLVWRERAALRGLSATDRRMLTLRAATEAAAAWFFFNALFNMPLANVTAILQALPLTVALAAWLVLREPLGWRRMTAIAVGFGGVLLIVRPGTDGFTIHSVYALVTVALVTVRDLLTRRMAPGVPSMLVAFSTALGVTLFGAAGAATERWVRPDAAALALLAGAVVFVFVAYALTVLAMRRGELTFVAPFRYAGLLAAIVLGWLVLDEWPAVPTFVGSAVVAVTGAYTLHREGRARRLRNRAARAAARC